jgi:RNA polymerase primary sigma factor
MNENIAQLPVSKNGLMAFLFNACANRLSRLRGERKADEPIAKKAAFELGMEQDEETENTEDDLRKAIGDYGVVGGEESNRVEPSEHEQILDANTTGGSSLSAYLRVVYAVPKMTAAEEKVCFERYRNGDMKARDDLVCANLWLVPLIVRRMAHGAVSLDELIEEGNFGIGVRFATYAKWWVVQAASQAISANGYPVRLPSSVTKDLAKLKKAKRADEGADACVLTNIHEAQRAHGWSDNYLNLLSSISEPQLSIDLSGEHDDLIYASASAANGNSRAEEPDATLSFKQTLSRLSHLIDELDERSRFILVNRFGLGDERPMTLQELGDQLGLSAERVRVIQEQVIEKLKHEVAVSA